MISDPTGKYSARIFSRSRGIGILSTGQILRYVARTPLKEAFEPFAELNGQDSSLQAYGKLLFDDPELNGSDQVMKFVALQWIDAADRLCIARRNLDGFLCSVSPSLNSPRCKPPMRRQVTGLYTRHGSTLAREVLNAPGESAQFARQSGPRSVQGRKPDLLASRCGIFPLRPVLCSSSSAGIGNSPKP